MCGTSPIQAAHTCGRRYDQRVDEIAEPAGHVRALPGEVVYVHPDDVVPLCVECHGAYDTHRLDLLPYLELVEQARVVLHVGLVRALQRVSPSDKRLR